LIDRLIDAMKDNLQRVANQRMLAPDLFIINVPPDDLMEWQQHQDILDEMAQTLLSTGETQGLQFHGSPIIFAKSNQELSHHNWFIDAKISPEQQALTDTAAMNGDEIQENHGKLPQNAFLVIGGKVNYPLEKDVINIGRHSDNDLSLEDPYISRHHAQLRAIDQNYVIFDVGSTGGLYLNDKKISKATLCSGDVVRMGAIYLIYIQDSTSANATTTMPADESFETDEGIS
jgi:hypothetical protein